MPQAWVLLCLDCGQKALTPEAQLLPCEVRCGVPYLVSDDNDQPFAAFTDVGSEFEIIPRPDGKGKDIFVIGAILDPVSQIGGCDHERSDTLVTLSEVSSPSSDPLRPLVAGAGVRDKFLVHSALVGLGMPAGETPSGLHAICEGNPSGGRTDRLGELVPQSVGAAAVDVYHHGLTHKPTDPHCELGQRGKMRILGESTQVLIRDVYPRLAISSLSIAALSMIKVRCTHWTGKSWRLLSEMSRPRLDQRTPLTQGTPRRR